MNRLMKVILENSSSKEFEEFDMTQSGAALTRKKHHMQSSDFEEVPLTPSSSSWEHVNAESVFLIKKQYKLSSYKHVIYFLNEIIKHSERQQHHPKITVEDTKITIELYTHMIGDVTESDLDFAKHTDELYEDVMLLSKG